MPVEVQINHLVLIEPRIGKARQRAGVDMGFVELIQSGDKPREHARIGRVHLAADQCEPDAGDRIHAEHAQHRDVRMAGADQHDILDDRLSHALHARLSLRASTTEDVSLGASDPFVSRRGQAKSA